MKNKPITLLFDAGSLANAKKSGVGFYTERLLHALATKYPDDLRIVGHYFNFLNLKQVVLPKYENVSYRYTKLFPSKAINVMRRLGVDPPIELFLRTKGDFILYPNFTSYPSIRKTPSATVIHDLGYIDFPDYVQAPNRRFLARYVPRSIKRSCFTVVISEVTKGAIMENYGTPAKDFVLTPIPPPTIREMPQKPKGIKGKYILFVGTLEPRKNFINLVRAYMSLPAGIRKEFGLVLAGGKGWYIDQQLAEIETLQGAGANIFMTGYFSDMEKTWLYDNASLFVQPSHLEGFGMPVLEAMQANVPTVVSDIPIFHEVCGDATVYFDPNDILDMSQKMLTVIRDKKLGKSLIRRGDAVAKSMKWPVIAENLFERIKNEVL